MKHNYATIQDFLLDKQFLDWVYTGTPELETFWANWLAKNPDKQNLLNQAYQLAENLRKPGKQLSVFDKDQLWQNITHLRKEDNLQPNAQEVSPKQIFVLNWLLDRRLVASVAAILLCAFLWFYIKNQPVILVQYATNYGQVKSLTLPDGSQVVLNGHSIISFPKKWDDDNREITLQGEALFQVKHTKTHQKFKVNLSDKLAVEVLGTSFTATSRPTKTRVVLSEGRVKMALTTTASKQSNLIAETFLKPGDLVEVMPGSIVFAKSKVLNPAAYGAFQKQKLIFEDTPLAEVARILQDNYGYQVKFGQPAYATKKFTGTIPANRIDLLFKAFEKLFQLKITRQGKQITIQ